MANRSEGSDPHRSAVRGWRGQCFPEPVVNRSEDLGSWDGLEPMNSSEGCVVNGGECPLWSCRAEVLTFDFCDPP